MRSFSTSLLGRLAAGLLLVTTVAACTSGGDGGGDPSAGSEAGTTAETTPAQGEATRKQIASRTTKWNGYNAERSKFAAKQNAVAKEVADRLLAGGLACDRYTDSDFSFIVGSYTRQGLPLPLGSGQCLVAGAGVDGGDENVLIEVFGKAHPDGADFVAAKRKLICQRAKDLGRLPDGTNGFDGIPYVIAADRTWVAQPDTYVTNEKIAAILGGTSKDMCEGIV